MYLKNFIALFYNIQLTYHGIIAAARLCPARSSDKRPARTVEELEAKLSQLRSKPTLAYKEKLQKKGLKTRLKKREKKEKRKLNRQTDKSQSKLVKSEEVENKPFKKPVYNSEGNLVFSKFDFSELGAKDERKVGKVIKDPKIALKKLKEGERKLKTLAESGEKEKVAAIKEKKAWKSAMLKAEGVKLKDDPELLKTSIKKIKKRKEKSEARWKANVKRVEREKEEKQRKRTENLQARSKEKKLKKMKTHAKRGRIIAGF